MAELKRYEAHVYGLDGMPDDDEPGSDKSEADVYLCSEVDALISELAMLRDQANGYGPASSYAEVCAERDALRQQVREVTEWRPMETAPTDREILLCLFGSDIVVGEILGVEPGGLGETPLWLPLPPLPKEVERG
jgi:hypothetical protein